jgi:hypothetical protein
MESWEARSPAKNGLKQGDVLTPLLFNFALEYARRGHHDWFRLKGTQQLLICVEDVKTLGATALVIASKGTGLQASDNAPELMNVFKQETS